MIAVDSHHWWYRGRRTIVGSQIAALNLGDDARLLDAGCGSGCTLDLLSRFGEVSGCDINPLAVSSAEARGHSDVRLGDLQELPFDDRSFELVTCLDVIEHVPDDLGALRELRRVTSPSGRLLVTVPAYMWLWSGHDVANHHMRRYTRSQLIGAAESAGWRLERSTYFYSWLLPPAALVRATKNLAARLGSGAREQHSELDTTPEWLDAFMTRASRIENGWLARGRSLPFGLSVMAVFVNPDTTQ